MSPMDCKLLTGIDENATWPDTVIVHNGDLKISFRRTIRVPDNANVTSLLPPDLGAFPLYPIKKKPYLWGSYWDPGSSELTPMGLELPEHMRAKGGIYFPMHRR
jgi:hypothetical protein